MEKSASIKKTILLINGPNLSLLGQRQPHIYGTTTLAEIVSHLSQIAEKYDCKIDHKVSNHEGELISFLNDHFAPAMKERSGNEGSGPVGQLLGIIVNAGAYTHTSIALRDALEMFADEHVPIYEVHLSNIFRREPFRHQSLISPIAKGVICGLGAFGYEAALRTILERTI
jgi:3-dehydroquinate dehydratase-2